MELFNKDGTGSIFFFPPANGKKRLLVCLFVFFPSSQLHSFPKQLVLNGNEALIICVLAGDLLRFFFPVYGSFQWGASIVQQKESARAARHIMELFICLCKCV